MTTPKTQPDPDEAVAVAGDDVDQVTSELSQLSADSQPKSMPPEWDDDDPEDHDDHEQVLPRDAQFVSQSVPASMVAGRAYDVSVTMRNTGSETWTAGALYRLGGQNPHDNTEWGFGRVDAPGPIAPGQEAGFQFRVTAPESPGVHHFQWRMLQESVEWFGDFTPNIDVSVVPSHGWFHCYVNGAGAHGESGRVYVLLDDTGEAFPARTHFWAHDGAKREILAAALTAVSTGQTVGVELDGVTSESRILTLHVG